MTSTYIYEPLIYPFSNVNALTINHGFGRLVNVEIVDSNNDKIEADVQITTTQVIIIFYEELTQTVISISGNVIIN